MRHHRGCSFDDAHVKPLGGITFHCDFLLLYLLNQTQTSQITTTQSLTVTALSVGKKVQGVILAGMWVERKLQFKRLEVWVDGKSNSVDKWVRRCQTDSKPAHDPTTVMISSGRKDDASW